MKNTPTLFIFLLFNFWFLNAQVTVFAGGINSYSLYLDGDDLYYTDDYIFYKFDISDIDFPTGSFVHDVSGDTDFVPILLLKKVQISILEL
jgi:hypothetical protein